MYWSQSGRVDLMRKKMSYPLVEFLFYEKLRSLKIPQELLVLWKFSEPFFSAWCI
jgi:hypothetical protein